MAGNLGRRPAAVPTSPSVRSPRTGGRDDAGSSPRCTGLEARIADAMVTRLVESRFSEALMEQILQALTESRDVEKLVVHLLGQPDVNGTVDALVDRQLGRVIESLRSSEALRELVREQVDLWRGLHDILAGTVVVYDWGDHELDFRRALGQLRSTDP